MSRRRHSVGPPPSDPAFWGRSEDDEEVEAQVRLRPSPDPGAVARSLGAPPLAVPPATARRHLDAVYEEAVRVATALAAANGLLDLDE